MADTKLKIMIPAAMREVLDEVNALVGPLPTPMNATIRTRTPSTTVGEDGVEYARFEVHYPMGVHVEGVVKFWASEYGEHRRIWCLVVRSSVEHIAETVARGADRDHKYETKVENGKNYLVVTPPY